MTSTAQKKALANYRRRLEERGIVRLEIQVLEEDAPLVRRVAKVLRHQPEKAAEVRRRLQEVTGASPPLGLKELLAELRSKGSTLLATPTVGARSTFELPHRHQHHLRGPQRRTL